MAERVWLSWEIQRRNRTLSPYLNAKLFELDIKHSWWKRYPLAIVKTLGILRAEKPRVIFAQNPSLILALFAVTYAKLFNKVVVLDAHNAGLFPLEGRYPLLNWIARGLARRADLTIVSNAGLVERVSAWGGNAVAVPDPFPELPAPGSNTPLKRAFNVLFICSWADDEPYREVIEAARGLPDDVSIYMTGNSKGAEDPEGVGVPEAIELTGFVSDEEFTRLLFACDAVMVLTTREDCLVCGGYEGVSAGKPLILSDTEALRQYFSRGSVYVNNTAASIGEAINEVRQHYDGLATQLVELKIERDSEYQETIRRSNELVSEMSR